MKVLTVCKVLGACIFALCIPALLVLNGMQSRKYTDLERQIEELEKRQNDLIEQNKKLITDISLLSSSDRIEKLAREVLDMRQAETEEIVRVDIKDKDE